MRTTLLLATCFAFTLTAFAQTEAITKDGRKVILNNNGTWILADCADLVKTETISGKTMTSAKENIILPGKSADDGITITMIKGSESLILNFGLIKRQVKCVNKYAPMVIDFTDGTQATFNHMSKLDCEGNFACFLGEKAGKGKELELLKTKKIKKIAIEYSDVKNDKMVQTSEEFIFTKDVSEKFYQTIQCLTN